MSENELSSPGDPPSGHLGLWSGVGLVVANTIGAGVFVSAGYMAEDLTPAQILLAWVAGAGIALAGVRAYAAVAGLVPRSGGEYRYLSDLVHPALGYLAGWGSFLVGFSAPIAINALAAGAFACSLFGDGGNAGDLAPSWIAAGLVVALTAMHALGLRFSKWTQDSLALLKLLLVVGFAALGLLAGNNHWPSWTPPHPSDTFPWQPFMVSLFFVGFAFSGWNASTYAAGEFRDPKRDVPRSMWIGCLIVAVLYLAVNWVFVANLDAADAGTVRGNAQVTLCHLVAQNILGPAGGRLMSVLAVLAFVSAISAMTFAGPRVYAAMARDGFLPGFLAGRAGHPPVGAVLLQGALALLLVFTHQLQEVLKNIGAVLMLFSALTVLSLFKVRFSKAVKQKPPTSALVAAALYVGAAAWTFSYGFRDYGLLLWVGVVAVVALAAYLLTWRWRKRSAGPGA